MPRSSEFTSSCSSEMNVLRCLTSGVGQLELQSFKYYDIVSNHCKLYKYAKKIDGRIRIISQILELDGEKKITFSLIKP